MKIEGLINDRYNKLKTISDGVSLFYGMKPSDLFERTRKRRIVEKRQVFMSISKEILGDKVTLDNIARFCEEEFNIKAFDHATVMYGIKVISNLTESNNKFNEEYEKVKFFVEQLLKGDAVFQQAKNALIGDLLKANDKKEVIKIISSEEVKDFFDTETSTLV